MIDWPNQSQGAMNAFYGNPDAGHDGRADPAWESANLVSITPPYRMVLAWPPRAPLRTIRVHRKCAADLQSILQAILDHYGSQQAIEAAGMHRYGGCYNFRLMRGGSSLSIHSWGAAIDLDPERNGFGKRYRPNTGMMPMEVVRIFEDHGWTWGGRWRTGDAMHFQAADVPGQKRTTTPAAGRARRDTPVVNMLDSGAPHTGILATEFGDETELQEGAYGGMVDPNSPGVALPFRFRTARRKVRVYARGKSVDCDIVDVGPWNIDDPYWETGARPRAEDQHQNGLKDFKGREVKNAAGIDLTPAVFDALLVPGRRGMRSVIVDWEFTDAVTPPPRPWKAPDDPAFRDDAHEDEPVVAAPEYDKVEVEVVQRRLVGLGYHQVGLIDGKWGGSTRGAVSAFKNDRHLGGAAIIDAALTAELAKAEAEGWTRPIAKERAEATEAMVAERAPEMKPIQQNRVMAFFGAVAAAIAALANAIVDSFKDVLTWVVQYKSYLGLVPVEVWLVIIAGALIYIYYNSGKGVQGIIKSVRTGERN